MTEENLLVGRYIVHGRSKFMVHGSWFIVKPDAFFSNSLIIKLFAN